MSRLKVVLLALVAVAALSSVVVASAGAAAKAKLLAGESGVTVNAVGTATTGSELQNAAGTLVGEGLALTTTLAGNEASLAPYTAEFKNVTEPISKEKCHSVGDAAGVVLVTGNELHLVFDSLSPLGVGVLFLVAEFEVICGTLKIKIRGEALGLVAPINTEVAAASTTLKGKLHCSATLGEPEETKYWNEAGTEKAAKLEAKFGIGFSKACEQVAGEISLEPSKMIEIAG